MDVRMIAHDMRAPLNALNLSIEAARKLRDHPEAQEEMMALAQKNAVVLSALIEALLSLGEHGAAEPAALQLTECQPEELILSAVEQVSLQAAELSQELQRTCLSVPAIQADRAQLVRVLVNLLGNAIKFTPRGGTISITAKPRINDGHAVVVFAVVDDGKGVAEDDIDQIFIEGVSAGRPDGVSAGLGLAVCREIVESHGGRIWVEAGRQKGAAFAFSVPVAP